MREDIGSIRGEGWVEVTCDATDCAESVEWRVGTPAPRGWVHYSGEKPLHTGSGGDYCPVHAPLATA